MNFSTEVIARNLPYLLEAARYSVLIAVVGMAISLFLSIIICAGRMASSGVVRRMAAVYVSFFRGVPLLVQILLFYYALSWVGFDLSTIKAAILATGMCSAAYSAEYLRGALNAIPAGRIEAAAALGFPSLALWQRILIPQAVRLALPSLVNEFIMLVKDSSLASVIGVVELTHGARNIASHTYRPLEIFIAAAAIYLAISTAIALSGRAVERQLQTG